jgi:hypothetical protein
MPENVDVSAGWKLDKRIPIALLGALVLQSFVFGMCWQGLNDRVGVLERNSVTMEQYGRMDEKMNILKDNQKSEKDDLQNIKDDIRRLALRGGRG